MNADRVRMGFESNEEFFRSPTGRHGTGRSLSALWQLFHGPPAIPAPVPEGPFLQHPE